MFECGGSMGGVEFPSEVWLVKLPPVVLADCGGFTVELSIWAV